MLFNFLFIYFLFYYFIFLIFNFVLFLMGLAVFQDAITEPSAVRAVKDSSSDPSGSSWATRAAAARTVK